ncbi:phosphohydrolase [Staphylococcus pettenkoferi]|uniref:metallophosphoesterase n=1 Tax=Staphylococcus pettenkoferi TaxID=170573 RepID=UPI000F543B16|nr:metallophosphoesterase [Staphylococcus pettenkoferi]RQM98502.1 phosphohydrolase [Staphylococcus pettenkoferi]
MKIGLIADLHVDRHNELTPNDYATVLSQSVRQHKVDLLIIAGDIANRADIVVDFIHRLEELTNITIRFVPGNHDLWTSKDQPSTAEILQRYREMDECLVGSPYIINDAWAIVGNTGWYDYSYASSKFTQERLARGKFYGATWQDKERIDLPYKDLELAERAVEHTKEDLAKVGHRQIILVTHVVTHPQFVVPLPHRLFDFFNAYLGTSKFADIYHHYPIRYSVMGHVHFRKRLNDQGIEYICPCLGYRRQWRTSDISREMTQTLQVIEI